MSVRDRIRKVKHLQSKYFVCVLENPDLEINVGSAMRNISAFGVEKLYVVGNKSILKDFETSRKNRYLKKLSVGSNKWVFVKSFKTTKECIDHLRKDRYTIAVTSPYLKGKKNINLYDGEFDYKRLAIWFGNESHGISDEAVKDSDFCIQIPMGGIVESLNLGTSTGIVLSYIRHKRLRHVFDKKKARIRPKGLRKLLMKSWEDFSNPINPNS